MASAMMSVIDVDNPKWSSRLPQAVIRGRGDQAASTPALRIAGLSHRYGRAAGAGWRQPECGARRVSRVWGPMAPARARRSACSPGCWPARAGRLSCFTAPVHSRPWPGCKAWCFSSRRWTWISSSKTWRILPRCMVCAAAKRARAHRRRITAHGAGKAAGAGGVRSMAATAAGWKSPRPAAPPASVAAGRSHRRPGHAGAAVFGRACAPAGAGRRPLAVLWANRFD